jgi:hypothetical protein
MLINQLIFTTTWSSNNAALLFYPCYYQNAVIYEVKAEAKNFGIYQEFFSF